MSRAPRYHIAHILPSSSWGGAEIAALRIAQSLGSDPFAHTVFCPNQAAELRGWFAAAGVETAMYEPMASGDHHSDKLLRASARLADDFKRRGVGLVHCAGVLAGQSAAPAGKLAGAPVVCHVRDRRGQIPASDQGALRAVDHFVFSSRDTWMHFGYEVAPGHGSVIYDSVEIFETGGDASGQRARREFGLPDRSKIVGMIGPIEPEKDFATLIKAAAQVVEIDSGVRFLIVGDHTSQGRYREYFHEVQERLAHRYLTPYFVFTGHRADLPRLLGTMDIVVHCAHTGARPSVIIEAMAHGRPILATAVGEIPELVREGETGWLHRHGDDTQLAAQILSLIHHPARIASLGEAGRQFVKLHFSHRQFAGRIADLYRNLLHENSPIAPPNPTDYFCSQINEGS